MNFGLTLLEAEAHRELPIPAWGFGVIAFVILVHPAVRDLLDRQGPPAQLMIDSADVTDVHSGPGVADADPRSGPRSCRAARDTATASA